MQIKMFPLSPVPFLKEAHEVMSPCPPTFHLPRNLHHNSVWTVCVESSLENNILIRIVST